MNSSFINFGNFFDINKYATDKYLSYWINNLIGFIVSKKIVNEVTMELLFRENSLIFKLKFLELFLLDFQKKYLITWKNINEKGIDSNNDQTEEIKHIYESMQRLNE